MPPQRTDELSALRVLDRTSAVLFAPARPAVPASRLAHAATLAHQRAAPAPRERGGPFGACGHGRNRQSTLSGWCPPARGYRSMTSPVLEAPKPR